MHNFFKGTTNQRAAQSKVQDFGVGGTYEHMKRRYYERAASIPSYRSAFQQEGMYIYIRPFSYSNIVSIFPA